MKLVLTSAGFSNPKVAEEFLKFFDKDLIEVRVLVVFYAQSEIEQSYINESKKELADLNLKKVTLINMSNGIEIDTLGDFDVIYICGGNTYSILKKMRGIGLDKFIINQIKNGAIYVGVSAGSIIAGKNIEIAGWGAEGDQNEVGLKDLTGLSLTDIAVFPHYKNILKDEVEKFREEVEYPVVELTDEQALFVIDGEKVLLVR